MTMSLAEFFQRVQRPGVHFCEYRHESDCPTLATGSGHDCTCDPELHLYECDDDGSRRYIGEVTE